VLFCVKSYDTESAAQALRPLLHEETTEIRRLLRDKMALICAVAGVTATIRLPIGEIRDVMEAMRMFPPDLGRGSRGCIGRGGRSRRRRDRPA
jgi:ketopantoate reductase